MMYQLRLLGGASLEGPDGPVTGRAAQRRPLALLALLAASDKATVSRDKAIVCLWPEADAERARHVLSVTLHALRKTLGSEAILSVGDDLRLNTDLVAADVIEFEGALQNGALERAVDLYTGPFLDGFHVRDAAGFERWLDQRQGECARAYRGALEELAGRAEERRAWAEAVPWWRERAAEEPTSSRVALRLMAALEAAGDRPAALRHARIHGELVREELGVEPDPGVAALAERLENGEVERAERAGPRSTSSRDGEPIRSAEIEEPTPGFEEEAEEEAEADNEETRLFGKRAPSRVALAAAVAVAASILPVWQLFPDRPAADRPPEARMAVFPFAVYGPDEQAYLGEGTAHLLSIALDGALELRTLGPILLQEAAPAGEVAGDLDAARRLAERVAAPLLLVGAVVPDGEELRISATLLEHDAEASGVVRVTVEGPEGDLLALVDRLAAGILLEYSGRGDVPIDRVAARTTESIPALLSYLRGLREYRSGDPISAVRHYERAVAADSGFALAYYRLAGAALSGSGGSKAREAARAALRLGEALPDRTRRLFRAQAAWLNGDLSTAERLVREVLQTYPRDPDAWRMLGEARYHLNPLYGRSIADAKEALERALSLDPDRAILAGHLIDIGRLGRDGAAVDSLWAILHGRGGTNTARLVRALTVGRKEEQEEELSYLPHARDRNLIGTLWQTMRAARHLPAAEEIARLMLDPSRSDETHQKARVALAHIAVARGDWEAADAYLAEVGEADPLLALEYEAYLQAMPFSPATPARLIDVRTRLAAARAPPAPIAEPPRFDLLAVDETLRPLVHPYLLGLLSARLGDEEAALRHARELNDMRVPGGLGGLTSALSRGIRALLAHERDEPEAGLSALEDGPFLVPHDVALHPFLSLAPERYLLGRFLTQRGRTEEALGWLGAIAELSALDVIFIPPASPPLEGVLLVRAEGP